MNCVWNRVCGSVPFFSSSHSDHLTRSRFSFSASLLSRPRSHLLSLSISLSLSLSQSHPSSSSQGQPNHWYDVFFLSSFLSPHRSSRSTHSKRSLYSLTVCLSLSIHASKSHSHHTASTLLSIFTSLHAAHSFHLLLLFFHPFSAQKMFMSFCLRLSYRPTTCSAGFSAAAAAAASTSVSASVWWHLWQQSQ